VLLRMVGTRSNRMAIGAKATVTAGKLVQTGEVRAGGSYLSSSDPRLHFGLGGERKIDQLEIRWPAGEKEILKDVPADFIYTITEGKGVTDKARLPGSQP
jgi:enediyne biosynthesis protein E4